MALVHASVDMNAWHCDACGFVHNITPDGVYAGAVDSEDDTPMPQAVQWIERASDPRFGRITNMEGG